MNLSKLMRDDPLDHEDAVFIHQNANIDKDSLKNAIRKARIPDIPEIREQFDLALNRFVERVGSMKKGDK